MTVMPYLMQDENITLFATSDGRMQPITVASTHPNFQKVREAIKNSDFEAAVNLADIPTHINNWAGGAVEVRGNAVYYNDAPIHNTLTDRILTMLEEGFDATPMLNFMQNLMDNPSKQSVQELYDFLDFSELPITEDGHFLAYKGINGDWTDAHTGTIDNSIGAVVEMPRNEVDDNRNNTCSSGLHFTSLTGHAQWYGRGGQRIVAVKINPRDVVSIPKDYNNKKGRCCRYEVFAEITDAVVKQDRDILGEHIVVSSKTGEDWDYSRSL